MDPALTRTLLHALLGFELGSPGGDTNDRLSLEGLTWRPRDDGAVEIGIRRLQALALRLAAGPLVLEMGSLALHDVTVLVQVAPGPPRLRSLEAAGADLQGVKAHGPVLVPPRPAPADAAASLVPPGTWSLGPLAAADGRIRAQITDAHLLFDADVTIPIRLGQIHFNDATVEHVGPDSRMGVSRMGLYVDAPNGRSYLYQFTAAPVAGVEFERRGAMLGPWVTHRGSLRLQEFGEGLLRQGPAKAGQGFTEQARLLLHRTSVSGDVQLGDGRFTAPGVQADLEGRAQGRNAIRIHSEAVGRGVTAELAALSLRNAVLGALGVQAGVDAVTGSLTLRLFADGTQLRFAIALADMKLTGLQLRPTAS